jgi:hypothetical protein
MGADESESQRRAAALEALKHAPPQQRDSGSFWNRHGAKVAAIVALALGLWLMARAVGAFMRHSISETERADEELRRGMRR